MLCTRIVITSNGYVFLCSNVAGFVYITDIDVQRLVLLMILDFIFVYKRLADVIVDLQEKNNIPCTISRRITWQNFAIGDFNVVRNLIQRWISLISPVRWGKLLQFISKTDCHPVHGKWKGNENR